MSGLDNTSFTVRTTAATTDTITNNDSVVIYTATSAKTVTLPDPASQGLPGRRYVVINAGAGAITLTPVSPDTIDGAATKAVTATTGRADFITDGTNWFTISAS